jgi:hypothetical protein
MIHLPFTFKDLDFKVHGNEITFLLSTSVIHNTNEVNTRYKHIIFNPLNYPEWDYVSSEVTR